MSPTGTGGIRSGSTVGSAPVTPSRWFSTTSGTRNERDSTGRSRSSTTTSPKRTSDPSGPNRTRSAPDSSDAPHSSMARPIDARRLVTSSWR
jgi:hypothetical protein